MYITFMTQSDKTSLIARKYTHVYNGIYLLLCRCYSNSVSLLNCLGFLLATVHGEVCAKILCSEKELLNLKDSKLTQNFYGNKTGFIRPGHIYITTKISIAILKFLLILLGILHIQDSSTWGKYKGKPNY